jgi:hypothetical protein
MAFLSKLYGKQVNKAAQLAAHKSVGSLLTFDSSADFPTPAELCDDKVLCGVLGEGPNAIPEYFNYMDTSTRNIYVDMSTNIMYRWKHFTMEQWKAAYWEQDEDGRYIAPQVPVREDFSDIEEYNTAVEEYKASLYPTCPGVPDASMGWKYVPCAGGGGGDLTWGKF